MDPNGRKRKNGKPVHGWVNLDKPYDFGSTKAVGRVRWLLEAQKAGHAGTLDPLATGVLPIALGEATKTVPYLMDADKAYTFDIRFGHETTTGDVEGEATEDSKHRPTVAELEAAIPAFTGTIEQVPPMFSAIKIHGKRAYDLARAGEAVEISSRTVRIDALTLEGFDGETARLSVECGKGTYVRSLARDLARAVGSRGHVTYLRRTRVGSFTEATAIGLDALEGMDYAARVAALAPIDCALDDIPVLAVGTDEAADLKLGRAVRSPDAPPETTLLAKANGVAVALCQSRDGKLHPKRVFNI